MRFPKTENYYSDPARARGLAVLWMWLTILLGAGAGTAYGFDLLPLRIAYEFAVGFGIVCIIWIVNPFFQHQVAAIGFIIVCIYAGTHAYSLWITDNPLPLT